MHLSTFFNFKNRYKVAPSGDLCIYYDQLNKICPGYIFENALYFGTAFEQRKFVSAYKQDIYYLPYMRQYVIVLFKNMKVMNVEEIKLREVQQKLKEGHLERIATWKKNYEMNIFQKWARCFV